MQFLKLKGHEKSPSSWETNKMDVKNAMFVNVVITMKKDF